MTTFQSIMISVIIAVPILLSRLSKKSGDVYLLGYLTGIIIACIICFSQ